LGRNVCFYQVQAVLVSMLSLTDSKVPGPVYPKNPYRWIPETPIEACTSTGCTAMQSDLSAITIVLHSSTVVVLHAKRERAIPNIFLCCSPGSGSHATQIEIRSTLATPDSAATAPHFPVPCSRISKEGPSAVWLQQLEKYKRRR
jgi:hypothetical protein